MTAHVIPTLIGVRDMEAAKRFYTDGLGWKIKNDYGISVFFESDGASPIGLYGREGLAKLMGTSPEGSGFSGLVLTYEVSSETRVDEVMVEAEQAGATILKPADALPWGGYGGTFADLEGYIWRVGHSAQGNDQPPAK
ncbi:VOC family protein [Nonomuraea recticatena]|uniref:VOC family protein n=1 Tax=Nonomuraea recticatena TaxID=46178 RepID=A0ABN3SMZ9_9ACTN